jgi:aspartyl-tRNA(Asn)/glutamyl-tRNA(Gln) amidotransferase subunit C
MTTIDAEMVTRLADLSSLALEEGEVVELTRDLSRIVEYVAILDEAEAPIDEAATFVRGPGAHGLRADEPLPSLPTDLALREAPRAVDGGFAVPGFVDEG